MAPSEVSDLLPPVLDALFYLHKNGFVHGRVKPSNVLAAGDQLKLSSDQVAPVAQQDGSRRRRDVYDAPETAAGLFSMMVIALHWRAELWPAHAPANAG